MYLKPAAPARVKVAAVTAMIEPRSAAAAATSGQLASSVVAVGGCVPRVRSQPSTKRASPTRFDSSVPSSTPIGMKRILANTPQSYRERAAAPVDQRHRPSLPLPSGFVLLPRIWKIVLLLLLFVVASFFIARWLTAENRERGAVVELLRAQKDGDSAAMLGMLKGCSQHPACRADVIANAKQLKGSGPLTILRYDSGTAYAPSSASGQTRVAWDHGGASAAVVQCVEVQRSGIAFLGGKIALRSISRPLPGIASCPG